MSGLEYWFDERKITGTDENAKKTAVKQKFQEMMLQNGTLTTRGEEVFNAIWENQPLARSLFGSDIDFSLPIEREESKTEFVQRIGDTNNSFYDFIKVK